jgi:hypothetical protein
MIYLVPPQALLLRVRIRSPRSSRLVGFVKDLQSQIYPYSEMHTNGFYITDHKIVVSQFVFHSMGHGDPRRPCANYDGFGR